MKKLLLIVAALAFTGCTKEKVGCAIEDAIVASTSAVVASELSCSNKDAIKADFKVLVAKAELCPKEENKASSLGDLVCESVVKTLVDEATSKIPATWGCTGNGKPEALKAALMDACKKAI